MKKLIPFSLGLLAFAVLPMAQANDGTVVTRTLDQALSPEQINSLYNAEEIDAMASEDPNLQGIVPPGRGGRGGIGRGGRGGGRGWNGGGRGRGWGGGRGWGRGGFPIPLPIPFPRSTSCYAQDAYGQTYQAYGSNSRSYIQQVALQTCYNQSAAPNSCRAVGCN
jgi:hypothetical protein